MTSVFGHYFKRFQYGFGFPQTAIIHLQGFNEINEVDISPDDSPQTEEHPYHSLSSSVATLRRYGTVSSLERMPSNESEEAWDNKVSEDEEDREEDHEEDEEEEEDEEDDENNEEENGIDNEAFNHSSSIRHWTIRAGSYVAEKMAFFEKLGEDYRTGNFFDR